MAVAWWGALSVSLLAIVVVGPLEVRQEGLEGSHGQAGQLPEDAGPSADHLEVQHASAPRSRRKGIAYPRDDLFPIKSNADIPTKTELGGIVGEGRFDTLDDLKGR